MPVVAIGIIESRLWIGVFVFFVTSALWSLFYAAQEVDQPFGDSPNSLPMRHMQHEFNASLRFLMEPLSQQAPGYGECHDSIADPPSARRQKGKAAVRVLQQAKDFEPLVRQRIQGPDLNFDTEQPRAQDSSPLIELSGRAQPPDANVAAVPKLTAANLAQHGRQRMYKTSPDPDSEEDEPIVARGCGTGHQPYGLPLPPTSSPTPDSSLPGRRLPLRSGSPAAKPFPASKRSGRWPDATIIDSQETRLSTGRSRTR